MLIRHTGFHLKDFYEMIQFTQHLHNKWEAIMGTHTQQKLEAPAFRNKHDLNATRDAFKVSRTTLYRWRKTHRKTRRVLA